MSVAVASGYTSQNIGNAFFQLGGAVAMRRAAAVAGVDIDIRWVPDAPGNWTLRRKRTGNPRASFDLLAAMDGIDLLVIQGPSLSWHVNEFWGSTLRTLTDRGTDVALVGVAFYRFDDGEVAAARRFLDETRIVAISTRDTRTAEIVAGLAPRTPLHDGIDSAFWLPFAYAPPHLHGGPFVAVTFDRYPEPTLTWSDVAECPTVGPPDRREALGSSLARRGKAWAYLGAVASRRRSTTRIGPLTVLRPEHRSNPPMHWKAYGAPNGLMFDEPYSYATVYANSSFTISDRVHACVASLAYGNRAMLLNSTPRGGLLDRVASIGPDGFLRADPARLTELREAEERFIADRVLAR